MAGAKITSINRLAELVGKSSPAVQKWIKRGDWPFGGAPWPVSKLAAIKAWAAENLQEDRANEAAASPEEQRQKTNLTDAKAKKTIVETKLKLFDLKEREGELHDVAACRQQQIDRLMMVKNALTTQLPREIVRALRSRDKDVGGQAVENDATEVVRRSIEQAIMQHLATGPTAA